MTTLPKAVLLVALGAACICKAAGAPEAAPVGMVLDVQGAAEVDEGAGAGALRLLAPLKPHSRIRLPAGSKASLTIYSARLVYRLTGPTTVDTTENGLTFAQGNQPEILAVGEKLATAAQGRSLVAGAYRMRNAPMVPRIELTSPVSESVVTDTRPKFSWKVSEAGDFSVVLQAQWGRPVYRGTSNGQSWTLPEGVQLERGMTYEWKVWYTSAANGEAYGAAAKFRVATDAEAGEWAALRPADSDPIEHWVLYAAGLQQRRANAEAAEIWQRIVSRRPDLKSAVELAK
jgi:hypothetical protein